MPGNIFITGGLGFLGKSFIKGLLAADPEARLFLLVREKGPESAEARLRRAGLWGERITPVAGDVTDSALPEVAAGLPAMDEFWHLAGLTAFHESKRDQLVRVNVQGTANALALAGRAQAQRFFHISTAYVAGVCDGPVMEDELLPNPVFRNPYEETKYHGERLVRDSRLPWVVIRPSIIMGHSQTGEADSDKMVYGVVRAYYSLSTWVNRDWRDRGGIPADLTYSIRAIHDIPKNYVCSDDIVRFLNVVRQRGETKRTYHACHDQTVSVGFTLDTISQCLDMGYVKLNAVYDGSGDAKQQFIDRGVKVYEPYMLQSDPAFDMTNAFGLDGWRPLPMDTSRVEFLIRSYVEKLRQGEQAAARKLDTSLDLSRLEDVRRWGDFALAHDTMSQQLQAFRADGIPGFIAYAVADKTAIVVGDPVTDQPEALLRAFLEWRSSQALSFCGLQLRRSTAQILRTCGIAVNKLGIETFMDLKQFDVDLRGGEYQKLKIRNLANIAARQDITLLERPIDLINPREVLRISHDWMASKKNRGELRLLLREISTVPEPGVRYCFLRHRDIILGYIFFTPMYRDGKIIGYYANIERYDLRGASFPAGFNAMRYIACAWAPTAKAEGCEVIALGMSPLFEVENSEFNDNPELTRLFRRIYDESELYAFQGIAMHKKQYPCRITEPVFIATEKDTTAETVLDVFKGVGLFDG